MPEKRTIVKKVANAILYSDDTIRIDNVRASYPHLFKPYSGQDGGTPKFSITGLGDKKTHGEAKNLCVEIINRLLKDKKIERLAADKKFVKDGDLAGKSGYDSCWTFSSSETNAPRVRNRDKTPIPAEKADTIYGGCYVNILLRPWVQDNQFGKRVNAGLLAVQFHSDGEAFGEGRITDDDVDASFDGDADSGGFDDETGDL